MESFEKMLEKLVGLKLIQKNYDFMEDLPEDIYEDYFKGRKIKASELFVDKHRWYETSTKVFDFNGRYLGVSSLTDMFSESSDVEDCYASVEFFEMEEVKTVTYKYKD